MRDRKIIFSGISMVGFILVSGKYTSQVKAKNLEKGSSMSLANLYIKEISKKEKEMDLEQ